MIIKSIRNLFKPKKENEAIKNRITEILGHILNKKVIIYNTNKITNKSM